MPSRRYETPVAMMTARLRTSSPPATVTTRSGPWTRRPVAGFPYTYSAPKFQACV